MYYQQYANHGIDVPAVHDEIAARYLPEAKLLPLAENWLHTYWVVPDGRGIVSLAGRGGIVVPRSWRFPPPSNGKNLYPVSSLSLHEKDGTPVSRTVNPHRWIAELFLDPPPKEWTNPVARFKTYDVPRDRLLHVDNIEWAEHGVVRDPDEHRRNQLSGLVRVLGKPVEALDGGRVVATFPSVADAWRFMVATGRSCGRQAIADAAHGRGKTAGGYGWRWAEAAEAA